MLKVHHYLLLATLGFFCLATGCAHPKSQAVSTTFVHKYGAAIQEQDWLNRGGNGKVIHELKNGVTQTENYINQRREGKTTFTFPYSQLIEKEEIYNQGHLLSTTTHFQSGVPKEKCEYLDDKRYTLTRWFDSGIPKSIETYNQDDLIEGEYYTLNNEIENRIQNGTGSQTNRNDFGEFISKSEYQNGKKTQTITCYANGDPNTITPYRHGKIHGEKKSYFLNGIPDRFEQWENGRQHGLTQIFRSGKCHCKQMFSHGKKHGTELIFDEEGHIAREISWKDDVLHGPNKAYHQSSVDVEWYYFGKKVSPTDYESLIFERP